MKDITIEIKNDVYKSRKGLLGYYYKETDFRDLVLLGQTHKEDLMYDQDDVDKLIKKENQGFASARWIGYIRSNDTEKFTLKTSDDRNSIIAINGEVISKWGEDKKEVTLEKGQPVFIEIAYNNTTKQLGNNFDLFKVKEDKEFKIEHEELLTPDNDINRSKVFIDKSKEITQVAAFSASNIGRDIIDTDGDFIPDDLEINGYTVRNNTLVPWKDEYALEGYVRYVSNPYRAYTSGDPYSDYEKVFGKIPGANAKEARNPLVAAYPAVGVSTEKFILSKNSTMSNSASSNESRTESNANTVGVSVTAEISGGVNFGWKVGVTGSYSNTTTKTNQWGSSTTNTEQFNTAEAGYLNANIRYRNTGSGAIYDVRPTTSFVLDGDTLHTITAEQNTQALSIPAGESYPKMDQAPIALTTTNGSKPITLNIDQLKAVLKNTPLITHTNQVDGYYAIINERGQVEIGNRWGAIQDEINSRTATIIFDSGDGEILERKVAAKDYTNPEDRTPSLSLLEALIASDQRFEDTEQGVYYNYEKGGKKVRKKINELSSIVVGDVYTINEIKKQINDTTGIFKDVKSIMDVKITPKMNIAINLAIVFDTVDLQQPINMYGTNHWRVEGGNVTAPHLKGDGQYFGNSYPSIKVNTNVSLLPDKKYVLKMWLKLAQGNTLNNRISMHEYPGITTSIYVDLSKDNYKEVSFDVSSNTNHITFYMTNISDSVYIDDIAIFEK